MTETQSDAQARLTRAVEGMRLTALRLRQELDRVAECGAEDLLHLESRGTSQVLVTTSGLLMVLQVDISTVLEARAEIRDCIMAEARAVVETLRAPMNRQVGEEAVLRSSTS